MLAALWEGRESAVCPADCLVVSTTAAECATFLLLRRPRGGDEDAEKRTVHVSSVADIFLGAVSHYLSLPAGGGGRGQQKAAEDGARDALARDLKKLEEVYDGSGGPGGGRGVDLVGSTLWDDECSAGSVGRALLDAALPESPDGAGRVDSLLGAALTEDSDAGRSNLVRSCGPPLARAMRLRRTGLEPSPDEVGLILTLVSRCGAGVIVPDGPERLELCTDGIPRWILARSLCDDASDGVRADFELLGRLLASLDGEERGGAWTSALRRLVDGRCGYTSLSVGLSAVADVLGADAVRCDVLVSSPLFSFFVSRACLAEALFL